MARSSHAQLKFVGVLAALYDHKPRADHPRDPAGYCQTCNGTAVIVVSPTSCIQNRAWLSFVVEQNRYSDLQAPERGLRINVAVMVLMMWNLALDKGWMRTISEAGR